MRSTPGAGATGPCGSKCILRISPGTPAVPNTCFHVGPVAGSLHVIFFFLLPCLLGSLGLSSLAWDIYAFLWDSEGREWLCGFFPRSLRTWGPSIHLQSQLSRSGKRSWKQRPFPSMLICSWWGKTMLASTEKEKASSCKCSWTSEHLFRSHLQVHVTWRLCGKCLTCAALASSCAWGVLLQMSDAEGPSFSSTAHSWKWYKPHIHSLCWRRGFQTLFMTYWMIQNLELRAGVSMFPHPLVLGKCCPQTGNVYLGSIHVQQPAFVPSVGLDPSHLAVTFPWSASPSGQSSFSPVVQPALAGPGCVALFIDWLALLPWTGDSSLSGPQGLIRMKGIKKPHLLPSSLGVSVCEALSTVPAHNDCHYVEYLLF